MNTELLNLIKELKIDYKWVMKEFDKINKNINSINFIENKLSYNKILLKTIENHHLSKSSRKPLNVLGIPINIYVRNTVYVGYDHLQREWEYRALQNKIKRDIELYELLLIYKKK